MRRFRAKDATVSDGYGPIVLATKMTNREYGDRFNRLGDTRVMKAPPGASRVFAGWLVVRRLETPEQYETWMQEMAFEDLYEPE